MILGKVNCRQFLTSSGYYKLQYRDGTDRFAMHSGTNICHLCLRLNYQRSL